MTRKQFIETFAHFMTEHDLNDSYDKHFPELGCMNVYEIVEWLLDILERDDEDD